jgi:hypothetical protein
MTDEGMDTAAHFKLMSDPIRPPALKECLLDNFPISAILAAPAKPATGN